MQLATYNQICIQHRALLQFKELALRSGIREGNDFPIDPEYCPLFLLKFHRIVFGKLSPFHGRNDDINGFLSR